MFDLSGKLAMVTGSSEGIGRGIAISLAQAGADVIINYIRNETKANEAADIIRNMGKKSIVIQADVSSEQDVKRMFSEIVKSFGKLDILVNNAGTSKAEDIFETTLESWEHLIKTNLTSRFLCAKEAMNIMKTQNFGRIIQISSIVAHQGALKGHVHYASTKSGQLGFTKTLARTGVNYGVTVNAIAPGIIKTDLLYKTHGEEGVEKIAQEVPLGLGTVEQIGAAAVFLASDEASYITGITLDVNGGLYIR